jgi:hypothetical protein
MATAYFEKFIGRIPPTPCPGCGGAFPLADFRKWWGPKRLLRSLCIRCEPNKTLSEMTPEQRANAVAWERPGATMERIQAMNERERIRERAAHSQRTSAAVGRIRYRERVRNWNEGILKLMRTERTWVERNLAGSPASDEWERFFEAYLRVLNDAISRIQLHAHARRGAPVAPTEAQCRPCTWVHEETLARLRSLYSACPVVRGRKTYRDPEFLSW